MNAKQVGIVLLFAAPAWLGAAVAADPTAEERVLERGRYLTIVGGCNDCHTPHYPEVAGGIPMTEWLTGNPVGFQGPWGTTYPANLRLLVQSMSESEWVARVRTGMRPPMPWFNLRDMADTDVRAIYRFISSLGPRGEPAPAYVPPGEAVRSPYIDFVPRNLAPMQARSR